MVINECGEKTSESLKLLSDIHTTLLIVAGGGCKDSSECAMGYKVGQTFWSVHKHWG